MTAHLSPLSVQQPQKIGILGMGLSGRAVKRRADQLGIQAVCWDDNQQDETFIRYQDWPFSDLDVIVISPGIPHNHPMPHPAAQRAQEYDVEIISEIEFALRTGHSGPGCGTWIVITGTNGKSTTTALLGHVLETAAIEHVVCGNIGQPVSNVPPLSQDGYYLAELSSYQLETTPSLHSHISMLLNISPDHLDRHGGMKGYITAKARALSAAQKDGLVIIGTDTYCAQAVELARPSAKCVFISGSLSDAEAARGIQLGNPALQGHHNTQNAASVRCAAHELGIDDDVIDTALSTFQGLAHRMQPAGQLGSIRFVNDSKATNGDAAARALASYKNIFWCAGGIAKQDGILACLSHSRNIRHAYFYGEAAQTFAQEAAEHIPHSCHSTLDDAAKMAVSDALADQQKTSDKNSVILLSPAAASFDQFANFEDRGQHFLALVKTLTSAHATHAGASPC